MSTASLCSLRFCVEYKEAIASYFIKLKVYVLTYLQIDALKSKQTEIRIKK